MISTVLTVTQTNFFIKSLLESDGRLNDFYISGEISNFTNHYRSGHLYFSLKDNKSVIKAVMFAGAARRLKFLPADGMKVVIRGRISVYEPSGQYQLYAEEMQPDGIGALTIAFEQLKNKLEAEGLFSSEYKKAIPFYPDRIGVVTSASGAAVQDILQITGRRWPCAEIILCPVMVQGDMAARQLTDAVAELNARQCCDVIIIGRGGGSMEDLQAFNDEMLARAIFASEIPVISAVGHETDFTICDFAADLRAPTPSAAAELATPDIREELQKLYSFNEYFRIKGKKTIEYLRQSIDFMLMDSPFISPQILFKGWKETVDMSAENITFIIKSRLEQKKSTFSYLSGKLDSLSPLKVLNRGYSVVRDQNEHVVSSIQDIQKGDRITVYVHDGKLSAAVEDTESWESG